MINFMENPIKVGRLTSNAISVRGIKVKIRTALKEKTESLVPTLTNIFIFLTAHLTSSA